MQPRLPLPIKPVTVVLAVFAIVELLLREGPLDLFPLLAVHVLVLGTFVVLPRAPVLVLGLLFVELLVVRETGFVDRVGTAAGLLAPFAATFAAAALVPGRRLWLIVVLLAGHLIWRATLFDYTLVLAYTDVALFGLALVTGALLQRRHGRLVEVQAERDRLVAALDTGPGDAATAEQLRMWSLLEHRIEPVVEALPAMVDGARGAADPAVTLETIRSRAADALAEMQATIRGLGAPEPPPSVDTAVAAPGALRRPVPLLWIACALLAVLSVLEMLAVDSFSVYFVALPLIPLLSPRAPVLASLLVGGVSILCSLDGGLLTAARVADFAALITLLVAGSSASPARAAASVVIVVVTMYVCIEVDPTTDWPVVGFMGLVLMYVGHWVFGVLLRDVAAEQRQVKAAVAETAEVLAELRERAVRRERVRLAHELHDLVGHALTAVAIQAGVAKAQLKQGRSPALGPLEEAARQGVVELQRLATVLGHEADLTAELERVTDTARATGQHVELELEPPATELAPQLRHTVVCIAAEALTNAAKHAGGAAVRVSLNARADRLELAVSDSGGHAHDLPSGGRGLDSMAQRVQACGGTFASGPRPGGGWTVQAVLPLSV